MDIVEKLYGKNKNLVEIYKELVELRNIKLQLYKNNLCFDDVLEMSYKKNLWVSGREKEFLNFCKQLATTEMSTTDKKSALYSNVLLVYPVENPETDW